MRTRRSAVLAVALLLLAGACSKKDESSPASEPVAAPVAGLVGSDAAALAKSARFVAPDKLTVCSDIPYAPFEFNDRSGGDQLTGFDVELVRVLAAQLTLTAEFKTTPFDAIIPSLAAGNCDMVASATTITEERKKKVAFTQPYFDADQALLVRAADQERYPRLSGLKGKTIGVQSGTTGETYAKANKPAGATVKDFPGADDLFNALASGDIDAVLQDFPVNKYRALKAPDQFAVTETFKTGEQYGFAVAMDNPNLVAALDAALASVRQSGDYDKTYKAWFGD
ncbi:MAG TPA: transporter substrate-binding domain-containing protein [Burkholderiales bacterium]|nr:transporter substrate-binding domain-containing protein [Burkholderiales bacterium]